MACHWCVPQLSSEPVKFTRGSDFGDLFQKQSERGGGDLPQERRNCGNHPHPHCMCISVLWDPTHSNIYSMILDVWFSVFYHQVTGDSLQPYRFFKARTEYNTMLQKETLTKTLSF